MRGGEGREGERERGERGGEGREGERERGERGESKERGKLEQKIQRTYFRSSSGTERMKFLLKWRMVRERGRESTA